jgi:hypothetical protein
MRRTKLFYSAFAILLVLSAVIFLTYFKKNNSSNNFDVVIYGGTSAGVIAAVEVVKLGMKPILIEPGNHLGGLTSGGLGATDIGNKGAIGGLSREFYNRVNQYYHPNSKTKKAMWTFEPHVAEKVFNDMVKEYNIPVVFKERLDLEKGVIKEGDEIKEILMESRLKINGKRFIDATYEGDLMALSGVRFSVGREANKMYGEDYNGVQSARSINHQFKEPIDPYVVVGDSKSGLLPSILNDGGPGIEGEGDHRIQAYCFRMCMTNVPENRMPFPKPEGYDALRYEILLRYILTRNFDVLNLSKLMPNGKTDTNNKGAFATDNIGMNYDYPNGDYETREKIIKEHELYQKGLMWFLSNDPRVPIEIREEVRQWGLPKDEFLDSGGWPHQLYIREARRMISEYVMTQHDCEGNVKVPDPVGLAAYTMDSHNVQRYVDESGSVRNEGNIEVGGFPPYPISYKSIIPSRDECTNLLVPVCLSSSHIAFGSIRMEPVFMVLAQSAAAAAVQSINANTSVQTIDFSKLQEQLLEENQVLDWIDETHQGVQKELKLIENSSSEASVKKKILKDVSVVAYPGRFMEIEAPKSIISHEFMVDEYFDYELNFYKIMNNSYGSAEVWVDNQFLGELDCKGMIEKSVPNLQKMYVPKLSKGKHKLLFKFNASKKIGIEKIVLTRLPIKVEEFLISQSFPGFMGKKGKGMYPANDKNIKWKKAQVTDKGVVRLDAQLNPKEECHAFAKTIIVCEEEIETTILFGHNDGAFIWLNGKLIHDYGNAHPFHYNEFYTPITLKKGENELMMMIIQGGGSWLFNVNLDTNQFRVVPSKL